MGLRKRIEFQFNLLAAFIFINQRPPAELGKGFLSSEPQVPRNRLNNF
jgi:hypothetical protein